MRCRRHPSFIDSYEHGRKTYRMRGTVSMRRTNGVCGLFYDSLSFRLSRGTEEGVFFFFHTKLCREAHKSHSVCETLAMRRPIRRHTSLDIVRGPGMIVYTERIIRRDTPMRFRDPRKVRWKGGGGRTEGTKLYRHTSYTEWADFGQQSEHTDSVIFPSPGFPFTVLNGENALQKIFFIKTRPTDNSSTQYLPRLPLSFVWYIYIYVFTN